VVLSAGTAWLLNGYRENAIWIEVPPGGEPHQAHEDGKKLPKSSGLARGNWWEIEGIYSLLQIKRFLSEPEALARVKSIPR
jgi:hypothetical protein